MRNIGRRSLASLLAFTALVLVPPAARAEPMTGVTTTNQLVTFDSATPGTISTSVAITGLQGGETILGIDYRPANGQLYALGSTSRLYQINPLSGAATQVGASGAFTLSGTAFGVDFNPVVDRIRVTSSSGQNLRLNPNDGALTGTDTALNPGSPSIVASAYTNNFAGAISTTLYDIDSVTDQLYTQNPPNSGLLNLVGSLGFNTSDLVGFDISGLSGTAFASLTAPGGNFSQLFTINLGTGAATLIGSIGGGVPLSSLSAQPGAVPEPATWLMMLIGFGAIGTALRRRCATIPTTA